MLNVLLNPAVIAMAALLLSIVWMLRDETDKTRPLLVVALVINFFYGWLLTVFMGREDSLVPLKYDFILLNIDNALGVRSFMIAAMLQTGRPLLMVVYQLMVPMMIAWFLVARQGRNPSAIVIAYVAEMLIGPLLYALVPGCGPVYAFHAQWLHPPAVQAGLVRLSSMPNAFPSLHAATALVFVSFAHGRLWRTLSLLFFVGTVLATIAIGEHYVVDLVAGLAFGCFAANLGRRRLIQAVSFLALILTWSLAVRFAHVFLIDHSVVLRAFAVLTVVAAIADVNGTWAAKRQVQAASTVSPAHAPA